MRTSFIAVLGLLAVAACSSGNASEDNGATDASEVNSPKQNAADNGAGAADAPYATDPCANPAAFAKANNLNLIVMQSGVHTATGTDGNDMIIGTPGDDTIDGGKGDDVICAGAGEDTVHGSEGNDYIDGGSDIDTIFGDEGNDLIHGRGGSDTIHGGDGDDEVFGDILDDKLFGDGGDDLIIGGHGTDTMSGGAGNDFLRGDTGNDTFDGGDGDDVASFATAMPPGQPDIVGKPAAFDGMSIDFSSTCPGAPDGLVHDGCANGDGGNEPFDSIETVIGSPYADKFTSGGKAVQFLGGYGADKCDGADCGKAIPTNQVFVTLDISNARDVGLVVVGTPAADDLEIVMQGNDFVVSSPSGAPVFAGPNCTAGKGGAVCTPAHVLRYIAAYGGDGNDHFRLAQAAVKGSREFPLDMTAHVSGGNDDDILEGGDEQDVLFTGPTGKDHLFGNDGDDALLSESRKWPAKAGCAAGDPDPACSENKPMGAAYTDGADELSGGDGDDQLVADYPCGGHLYSGGTGKDIAGFARSGMFDIKMQFTGVATVKTAFYGKSYNPQLCDVTMGTTFVADDMEIMEASDGNDELWGNDAPQTVWGRDGNDIIHGLGGNDLLMGLLGDDTLYGGAGVNDLEGGAGKNTIFQQAN